MKPKKIIITCIIVAVGIAVGMLVLIFVGKLLYKHLIYNNISDRGGMVNPDYIQGNDNTPQVEPTEKEPASKEHLDLIGLNYYFTHGSMAGEDYSYSISKDTTGIYQFHAELKSGESIVDKEISKKDFDLIMQMVNDNYVAETDAESEDAAPDDIAFDADSSCFEAINADGQTYIIYFGQAGNEILLQMEKFLEDSYAP